MQITHLSLTNFRNFTRVDLQLPPGITLLYGNNAQGKTNLLEAIYYLATTRSPHTNQDNQLLNWDAGDSHDPVAVGRLVAHVETRDGLRHLEMRLIREQQNGQSAFRREALVDRRKVRLMDLLGNLRVVLFLPQDMLLIDGPPSGRRRYIDITLCQTDPLYCRALSQYNKVLEQRNALLRRIAERGMRRAGEVLSIYSDQLADLGGQIFARRALFLSDLAREVQRVHYELLTGGLETIRLAYLPRLSGDLSGGGSGIQAVIQAARWLSDHAAEPAAITGRLRAALDAAQEHDVQRGATSVGPHRDDWRFWVNGRSLDSYGSRGQQRSAVLALKLGEIGWIQSETNDRPILLLDDVMAELDPGRRKLLMETLTGGPQALVTTADIAVFPTAFVQQANTLTVQRGRFSAADPTEVARLTATDFSSPHSTPDNG